MVPCRFNSINKEHRSPNSAKWLIIMLTLVLCRLDNYYVDSTSLNMINCL